VYKITTRVKNIRICECYWWLWRVRANPV